MGCSPFMAVRGSKNELENSESCVQYLDLHSPNSIESRLATDRNILVVLHKSTYGHVLPLLWHLKLFLNDGLNESAYYVRPSTPPRDQTFDTCDAH